MSTSERGPVEAPVDPSVLASLAGRILAEQWPAAPTAAAAAAPDPSLTLPGPDTPPEFVPPAPRGEAPLAPAVATVPELTPPEGFDLPSARDISWTEHTYTGVEPGRPGGDATGYGFLADPGVRARPRDSASTVPTGFGAPPAPPSGERETLDVASVRAEFPILSEQVNGHPLIWLDNAATTQKPRAVIDRLVQFYEHENSNIHRAAHELAARATDAYEDARDTVRRFLGAGRDEEVTFVRGTTEGINLVAQAWGRRNLRPGDEILITHLEHHANIVPWQQVARATGAVLRVAPVDDRGNLLLDRFTDLLGSRTKLVAVTAVSNALGTVTPIREIVEAGHRVGARVLIDGAQSVAHLPTNLSELGADFLVFSGHKIYGPTGIGALYVAERVWDETPEWQGGGNMIADVTLERSLFQGPPNRWEAGTGNIADAVGLATALRFVEQIGLPAVSAWEHRLVEHAVPRLAAIPGLRIVGEPDQWASVISFVLEGHDPVGVGKARNAEGIAVRAGHHCAQPILRRFGLEATIRPSFAFYNTLEEADTLVAAVRRIAESPLAG